MQHYLPAANTETGDRAHGEASRWASAMCMPLRRTCARARVDALAVAVHLKAHVLDLHAETPVRRGEQEVHGALREEEHVAAVRAPCGELGDAHVARVRRPGVAAHKGRLHLALATYGGPQLRAGRGMGRFAPIPRQHSVP